MKILEELWYGNVTPGERSVEKVDRLWNLGKLILQNEEELAPLLSEKAKEVLEKLRDNQSELNGYTSALKAPVRCFGNHLSGKRKSWFRTDNECGGAAILKTRTSRMGTPVGC